MSGISQRKNVRYAFRFVMIAFLLAITIWGVLVDPSVVGHEQDAYTTVNDGWVQVIDGVEIPLETAQDAQAPEDGSPIVLQRVVSDAAESNSLLFFASHQEVEVYIGDELQYALRCPEVFSFFASPGRSWVEVPIHTHAIGQTLRVEFSSAFDFYNVVPNTLYYVHNNDTLLVESSQLWLQNTVALAVISLAVISYVNASIWKYPKLRRYIFSLADLYLFSGLWLCGEINVLASWTGHIALSSMVAMIVLRVIPVVFHQLVIVTVEKVHWWMTGVQVLAWVNLIVSVGLQFMFGVSLVETLPWTIGVFVVGSVIYLVGFLVEAIRQWGKRPCDLSHYVALMFPVASLMEIYCYIGPYRGESITGTFIAVACILYSLFAHVKLVKNEAKTDVDKRALERHQRFLEKKPLYQQINAHFLFNTLNTISAYCKSEPAKADRAVNLLSQYMRRYTKLVDTGDYVSFREEVTLIDLYLEILNLRYEEEFILQVNAQFKDFFLPPLTLQPLVENAVAHGLHTYVDKGLITIQTKRYGGMIELIVSDNGHGFDTKNQSMDKGVGLTNTSRRIIAMGGSVEVKSEIGKGTDVILCVPLQVEDDVKKERET